MMKQRIHDAVIREEEIEKDTNFICVDRHNIIHKKFQEFESIEDFNLTFEVDFMGERAKDLGGPRKEWIRLMNLAIKEKYLDHGLREYMARDYYKVGIMNGVALLQNVQLPTYMPVNVIDKLIIP